MPAISRSLMDIVPFGFVGETRFCWMSSGHSKRHIMFFIELLICLHVPPTAC